MTLREVDVKIDLKGFDKKLKAMKGVVEDEQLRESYAPSVKNADNQYLGGDCWVDEVNGPGATEVPDFDPTRHELVQLVRYWMEKKLRYEFTEELCLAHSCPSGLRQAEFAWRRIVHIGRVLGREQVREAIGLACQDFGKKLRMIGDQKKLVAFLDQQDRMLGDEEAFNSVFLDPEQPLF